MFAVPFFRGLAVHLDGILFFLLIGITALLRLLAKKAKDAKEGEEEEVFPTSVEMPPPLPGPVTQTDEERIRRFLNALGQPASSQPPPPLKRRSVPTPLTEFQRRQSEVANSAARRRNVLNPVPPLTTVPSAELPRRVTVPRPLAPELPEAKIFIPQAAESTVFEVQGAAARASALPVTAAEAARVFESAAAPAVTTRPLIRTLLGSPEDLRRAIILREVFGPPRGLQALDSIGAESV